eukprot:jgi/Hompol1/4402/HPOL_003631-RA
MRRVMKPQAQVKLTNVAIVRLRKGGNRFEVACYKNKILEWRNKVEKDLDNVLQNVFLNVSKGQVASKEDLIKSFGSDNQIDIVMEILERGEIQVGEKERSQQLESMFRDIATTIAEKTVDPETKRPYTVSLIEKALSDIHFSVNPNKSTKVQANEAIRSLQEKGSIRIARAQMRVRIVMPTKDWKRIQERVLQSVAKVEQEDLDDDCEIICVIDPGSFRTLGDLMQEETKGRGVVEVLTLNETADVDI